MTEECLEKDSDIVSACFSLMCNTWVGELGEQTWPHGSYVVESGNPFDNTGGEYKSNRFWIEAYSWDEEYDQKHNFKWRSFRALWYKHCGRGLYVNRQLEIDEAWQMLSEWKEEMDARKEARK